MDRLDIIEALKHAPDRVEAEIAGMGVSALRHRPADGAWSIKEVVGHLRDMAEVWHERLYMVWSQTDPLFRSFDGDASVIERGYQDADLAAVIAAMREQRLETIALLEHAVDWTRLGQQRGVGRRTLKQFAEYMVSHDEEHIEQIRFLKRIYGVVHA
jgi:hypothetical protein